MRELRGEMERLRSEREEWEAEAGREREKREEMEDELRAVERREADGRREWEEGRNQLERERERADNLQEVLGEFQAGESSSCRQLLIRSKRLRAAASNIRARGSTTRSCDFFVRVQASRSKRRDTAWRSVQYGHEISFAREGDTGPQSAHCKAQA
jgi:chromosome segregation ATPase